METLYAIRFAAIRSSLFFSKQMLSARAAFALMFLLGLLLWTSKITQAQTTSFTPSTLNGISIVKPTSLQFGPDNRLYASQQNGVIYAYTVVREQANTYVATSTEVINLVQQIPNHNDNGALSSTSNRQVTGILLAGTSSAPVLYVTSSDPRIGGGGGANDSNLDTNSSIISRLTKTASGWDKVDLVRGLPRSEENHSANGMQLDVQKNVLYVTVGGNTNAGGPSNNFAFLTEYALSAAILAIDLTAIELMPTIGTDENKYKYDLPTLDDPTRSNNSDRSDLNDPFGGNDGLNQAILVPGGPVQIYASGFRNAFDLVLTSKGRIYSVDNGANGGWGGHPAGEGPPTGTPPASSATNKYLTGEPGSTGPGPNDAKVNNLDALHFVTGPGYYGGHPAPIRANPAGAGLYTYNNGVGTWRTSKTGSSPLPSNWPPVPPEMANPVEGDFRNPGSANGALRTWDYSTNGIAEYTASNFNGALKGTLLTSSFNGHLYQITLNETGTEALSVKSFASGFGSQPLDVIAQSDEQLFGGTIWAAAYGGNKITVFEPSELADCSNAYSLTLDEDGDGYSNADEIDNGTNSCSAASTPADSDRDFVSNHNDPDDDNDGLPDTSDKFALDPDNGTTTHLPISYSLLNNDPGTGLFGLGFTGLMTNNSTDYLQLYDPLNLIAGGTAGLFTIDAVTPGDALQNNNSQANAFQFGMNVTSGTGPFTVQSRILDPFFNGQLPKNGQSQGFYIGTGDQNNYLKIVLNANNGNGGIQVLFENNGTITSSTQYSPSGLLSTAAIDLFLSVNPATGRVQPKYAINGGKPVALGSSILLAGPLLTSVQQSPALAVGLIATSANLDAPFTATWDFINVAADPTSVGQWQSVTSSNSPIARHENAYVQVGDKFYLVGGRGSKAVQIYNPATKSWTNGATPPLEIHHFQAVELNGLLYVAGGFTGGYPNEIPLTHIYIYDPATNTWRVGPEIPTSRRRGSAGVVAYNNKFYLVCGIKNGHQSGHVAWLDEFDPATNTWKILPDAPRVRDHFQAAVIENRIYAAGGRATNMGGNVYEPTIPQVDFYDFTAGKWMTLPSPAGDILTRRGGTSTAVLGNELLVIGGESGSQSSAHNQTEALNVYTHTWRSLGPLIQGRHGTQAIVSNEGIYTVGGSGGRGGGPELATQEAFYMNEPTTPSGPAVTRSKLTPNPASVDFGALAAGTSGTEKIILSNVEGNQGILVTAAALTGASDFSLTLPYTLPVVVGPGQQLTVEVLFKPSSGVAKTASLQISHSGSNSPLAVSLSGNDSGANQPPTVTLTAPANNATFSAGAGITLSATAADTDGSVSKVEFFSGATKLGEDTSSPYSYSWANVPAGSYSLTAKASDNQGASFVSSSAVNITVSPGTSTGTPTVLYRINPGGTTLAASPISWSASSANPSPYLANGQNKVSRTFTGANTTGAPSALFNTYRWDPGKAGDPLSSEMRWAFPVSAEGSYQVKLFFAETYSGTMAVGKRVFDVVIEGDKVLNRYDIYAEAGKNATVKTFTVSVSDGQLNIDFLHVVENPQINGIEITALSDGEGDSGGDNCVASGTILREHWANVSGTSISAIPVNTPPSNSTQLTIFEGPTNIAENYGSRIRGYICPPQSGNYTFWIAGNDNCELWLSHDEPVNKTKIAFVNGYTTPRQWTKYASQKSAPIRLEAGKQYYIEALQKEGVNNDNLSVGWQLPGGVLERPIPGNYLSPFVPGSTPQNQPPTVTLTAPANNATFTAGASVTLSATASDTDGSVSKVEFFSGATKLGEDASSPYSYSWANVPAGSYSLTAKASDNQGASFVSSSAVNITVSPGTGTSTPTVLYRINPGGTALAASPISWSASSANPSPYLANGENKASRTFTGANTTGAPNTLFNTYRWDPGKAGDPLSSEMRWAFPVSAEGSYQVKLFFAETYSGTMAPGKRVFDVVIEGNKVLNRYDIYAEAGKNATVKTFTASVSDGQLNIDFLHIVDNPQVNGIEIVALSGGGGTSQNQPPTVTLTAPANNATYSAGASVTLSATAADTDGSVSKVEFFSGATKLGEDTSSPYSYSWTNVPANSYSLTAKASDNQGTTGVSSPVNITVSPGTGTGTPTTHYRINSGGGTFSASGSRQFVADTYYGGTNRTFSISSGDILNTTDDVMYRTERSAPSFNYSIPVQNGTVNVVLHFAEIWWGAPGRGAGGAGKRIFHVDIEGSRKLTNYDIFAKAGGAMKAIQETIPVTVTDGVLNINFLSGSADMPKVSAIEVLPQTSSLAAVTTAELSAMVINEDGKASLAAFPNPFSNTVKIAFTVLEADHVTLDLHDMRGTLVRRLYQGPAEANKPLSFEQEAGTLPEGVYIVRLMSKRQVDYIKVVLRRQ